MKKYVFERKAYPIFVFEVDDSWTQEDVQSLLVFAKVWGADEKRARFVLVLSAAVATYNLKIQLDELRCITVKVDEATDQEAEAYFKHRMRLSPFVICREKVIINNTVKKTDRERKRKAFDKELDELVVFRGI